MKSPTSTLLGKVKREAKALARTDTIPYNKALDVAAQRAGYADWHELHQASKTLGLPSSAGTLPLDPTLPPLFDDTPNEERPVAELDAWWDRPYALTRPDGRLDVRCLDGGAWDRSTWYGVATDMAGAVALAEEKLAKWRAFREQPVCALVSESEVDIVRMPQRPDRQMEILATVSNTAEAKAWLDDYGRQ